MTAPEVQSDLHPDHRASLQGGLANGIPKSASLDLNPRGDTELAEAPLANTDRRRRVRNSPWWATPPPGDVTRTFRGDIVRGDALATLEAMSADVADIVFLDPPFNLGKRYGTKPSRDDHRPEDEYRAYMNRVLDRSIDVLKPGGSLYLYHIPRWALDFAAHLSVRLAFAHWIAVTMKNGFVRRNRLYPAHYALVHFSKGELSHFTRPRTAPLTCPHCGEFVRSYGGYEKYVRGGINLSDVWDDVSPVRHARYRLRDANALPPIIPHRVVQMSGRKGGLLVDPFAGTGSSLVAARLHSMRFVGADTDDEAYDIMLKRLTDESKKSGGDRDPGS